MPLVQRIPHADDAGCVEWPRGWAVAGWRRCARSRFQKKWSCDEARRDPSEAAAILDRGLRALALACTGAASVAAPAPAAVSQSVKAAAAVDRSCHGAYVEGAAGTQSVTTTAPDTGLVGARLSGQGD